MRDMFDEFMEELRRREAQARGESPPAPRNPKRAGPDRGSDPDEPLDESVDDGDDGDDGSRREPPRRAGDGPRRPRPVAVSRDGGGGRRVGLWVVLGVVLAVIVLFGVGLDLWTDALWFTSVGFDTVFWTRVGAQLGLFAVGLLAALAILLSNLWLAGRFSPAPDGPSSGNNLRGYLDRLNERAAAASGGPRRMGSSGFGDSRFGESRDPIFVADDLPDLTPLAGIGLAILAGIIALTIGAGLAGSWETILLWVNRVPFAASGTAVTDPVFGRDIGFFLFELPFLRLAQGLFNGIVIATLIVVGVRYLVGAARGGLVLDQRVRLHLAVLGALFLLSVAIGYQLDKFELVYSTRGVATGVSYTDQNAQFVAFNLLTVISGVAVIFLVAGALMRRIWPLGLTLGVWFIASIVLGSLYPAAIEQFTVTPNRFEQEQPFIANNIKMTRLAFGLDDWEDRRFQGEAVLTQAAIDGDADTFRNARLWDYRPLATTLDQLQTIRTYYDFTDVDTDRYIVDGVQRQVMLAARELALDQNTNATGWVTQRIIYTHGIGVAMVPVNEVANEGQPRLFIGNVPPVSTAGSPKISEPRIYFGERASEYVIVGARQAEFDYPTGEGDDPTTNGTATSWTGTSGIKLDNPLTKLLYSLRFRDLNLFISDQLTPASQLLFHRSLSDRLDHLAPFLQYDKDPYLVINDAGRLVYVQDAYTTSDRFPNAQAFDGELPDSRLGSQTFNYIRNSVKVTMDAYDGTMHFYVSDPNDPIIRAYQGIFPTLFEPLEALPADLQAHLRVPEELFNVQNRVFGRYHVTEPGQFFNSTDLWTVPQGQTSEATLPSEAYYVVMRMPGESSAEFLLLQPMVPKGRPNMIAWVAARMDAPNYGTTRVYRFPADTTIFGPAQIEARIDQDPLISQQVTLWSQAGSTVIRGNLIVVPVGDSLLYLQPVYLQSTGSAFPEFQRIVVASPREVVWAPTLGESLRLLLEAEGTPGPGPSPTPTPTPTPSGSPGPSATPRPTPGPGDPLPTDVAGLIDYANRHFDLAQAALRDGDFATYGEEIGLVQAALERLDELAPSLGLPSPTP
jgi:uncharacterized protein